MSERAGNRQMRETAGSNDRQRQWAESGPACKIALAPGMTRRPVDLATFARIYDIRAPRIAWFIG
ncbi:MAG: hypothetical protein M3P18_12500, partial [Actinomycetota bacterium]|nr:hypothetical protein [Actinomycetota bacterium]